MSNLIITIDDDMRVFWRDASTGKSWKKWKSWRECTEQEKQQANLREIRKDEIVLDDDKNRLQEILQNLDREGLINRIVKKTIKSGQISLFFSNLANLDEELRTEIRRLIIEKHKCDLSKISEKTLVVIENRPHHKNPGLICEIIERKDGFNKVPEEMIKEAREIIKNRENTLELTDELQKDINFKKYFENDPLFRYISNNIIPDGWERNNVLFKNLAIGAVKTGKNDTEIKSKVKPIIERNFPSKNYNEFKGWLDKAREGELGNYNIIELNNWGKKYLNRFFYETEKYLYWIFKENKTKGTHYITLFLLKKYNFITLSGMRDEIYIYEKGVYVPKAEAVIKEEIEKRILKDESKTNYITEIINKIARNTYIDRDDFKEPLNKICLENGILNIDTFQIEEFSPNYFFLSKIPITYNSQAECPKIKKFIKEVLIPKEDWNKTNIDETDILTLQEFIGYFLYKKIIFNRAAMLYGGGENGKSTFINLIKKFLGEKNVANVPIQKLETNTFAASSLLGKLANLHSDLPRTALKETSKFKLLTGGDSIDAEKKFRDNFSFIPHAKMIFAANKLPETYDDTTAFWRRWLIFRFPNSFSEDDKNTNKKLLDELTTKDELSGLLNWALEGLNRLLANGGFTKNKSTKEIREEYIRQSDSIGAFILDYVEESPGSKVPKKEIYEVYVSYCRIGGYDIEAENTFHKKLRMKLNIKEVNPLINGKQIKCWSGIRLKNPNIL